MQARPKRPKLFAYGRRVSTPFGLFGHREKALTFALGYTLWRCPLLLKQMLSAINVKAPKPADVSASGSEIRLEEQETGKHRRTDVEIKIPGYLYLIIEGKIERAYPKLQQLNKYLRKLERSTEKHRKLLIVMDRDDDKVRKILLSYCKKSKRCNKYLKALTWESIIKICGKLDNEGNLEQNEKVWLRRLVDFLISERHRPIGFDELEDPEVKRKGKVIWHEVRKLVGTNKWDLKRQPNVGLFGYPNHWCGFVMPPTMREVFGIELDTKKRQKLKVWYVWFRIPSHLPELSALPTNMKTEWERKDIYPKYFYVWIEDPCEDIAQLENIFEATYREVHHEQNKELASHCSITPIL